MKAPIENKLEQLILYMRLLWARYELNPLGIVEKLIDKLEEGELLMRRIRTDCIPISQVLLKNADSFLDMLNQKVMVKLSTERKKNESSN